MNLKNLIVPTSENDYAPHLLQKTAFLLLCGLVVLSFALTNVQSLVWQSSKWLVGTVLPAVVVEQTNAAREKLSERPLQRNSLLDEAARLKAEDMAKNDYFAHYSPTGVSPWYWFNRVGYVYAHAGENLAVHFTDSKAVVDAWLTSPAHRANIENTQYLEIGVGTAEGEYEGFKTIFVVQLFGTPAAPFQPLLRTEAPVPVATEDNLVTDTLISSPTLLTEAEVLGESTGTEDVIVESPETGIGVIESIDPQLLAPKNDTAVVKTEEVAVLETFAASTSAYAPLAVDILLQGGVYRSDISPAFLATTPATVLRYVYLSIGTLVAIILLLSVMIAVRYHRPWQIAYGIALLVLMSGLFYLQSHLTSRVVLADTTDTFLDPQ